MSEPHVELARAKLTLSLRIVGARDDGYHLIDAEMATLALHDTLTFSTGDGLTVDGPFAAGAPLGDANLVRRALAATGRTARIHLRKEIPAGGGLGGGSADAAAVLRWAGQGHDLGSAARLGADVPFCLAGGRARVEGIGERLTPLAFVDQPVTLILPPLVVATAEVYRAWDALGGPHPDGPNDLEPAAVAVAPELARWRDRIREAIGQPPVLAGSGATWFVLADLTDAIADLDDALAPATCLVTRTDRP